VLETAIGVFFGLLGVLCVIACAIAWLLKWAIRYEDRLALSRSKKPRNTVRTK
jgi:hypothetical protein